MKEEEKLNPADGEMEGKASFKEDNKDVYDQLQQNNGDGDKDKDDDDKTKYPLPGGGQTGPTPKE